jgi:MFS transporter, DHA2 family, multidrug resistance protein
VDPANPHTQTVLAGLRQLFVSRGADPVTAAHRAEGVIWGMVQRQASMLAYNDAFRFLGGMFLILLPLLFLIQKPKGGKSPPMAH